MSRALRVQSPHRLDVLDFAEHVRVDPQHSTGVISQPGGDLVDRNESTLRMTALADERNASFSRLSHVCSRLEKRGLVEHRAGEDDRRATDIRLTSKGRREIVRAMTSKNGPAKASFILILLLVLGVGAIVWLLSGQDPALALLLGLVNIVMVLVAFMLAIIGLVIAIRRPIKKREPIFGLVVSSLMLIFLVVRLVMTLSVSVLDAAALESQIATWAGQQTSETFQVDCPTEPSATDGTVFTCAASGNAGTAWTVQVTVNADDTVGWEVLG